MGTACCPEQSCNALVLVCIQVCSDAEPMHCSTGQGRKASPMFSAALQNSLTACMCLCRYTYGHLLLIKVCSDATPMDCTTGQGRKASPLFSAGLHKRLTACLCHCNHTYGDLLFIQVCSDATPMHCTTGQGRKASPLFSAALQKQAHSMFVPLQSHLWRFALHTGVQ